MQAGIKAISSKLPSHRKTFSASAPAADLKKKKTKQKEQKQKKPQQKNKNKKTQVTCSAWLDFRQGQSAFLLTSREKRNC